MNQQFGDVLVSQAGTFESAIVASHAAVVAVFTAKIGNLHHGTDKSAISENFAGGGGGLLVQALFLGASRC
jgi:hypothetical protein